MQENCWCNYFLMDPLMTHKVTDMKTLWDTSRQLLSSNFLKYRHIRQQ